jgi:hypothetical protein
MLSDLSEKMLSSITELVMARSGGELVPAVSEILPTSARAFKKARTVNLWSHSHAPSRHLPRLAFFLVAKPVIIAFLVSVCNVDAVWIATAPGH